VLHAGLQAAGNGLAWLMSLVLDGSGGQNRVKRKLLQDFAVTLDRGTRFNKEFIETMKLFGIQPKRTSFRSP
jgi:hypothetical protein